MENANGFIIPLVQQEIKRLTIKGYVDSAAYILLELAQKYDPIKEDEVIALLCSKSLFDEKRRLGTITLKEEDEQRNNLVNRLLLIAKSISHV